MASDNVISIENLSKSYSEKALFLQATFGIHKYDRIGLLGINGCGKSTFMKILAGIETPDEGKVTISNDCKIGYLPQTPQLDLEMTIYDHIYFSDHEAFRLLKEYNDLSELLEHKSSLTLLAKQKALLEELDRCSAWEYETKAKTILSKLGFSNQKQKLKELSGGQRRRVDIARVLMDEPDILLLDEPTNHLDVDTIEWLQNYLAQYQGIAMFVTHDRYFLDAVSSRIMEIEEGKIRFYEGSYSYYVEKKQMEAVDTQRKEVRRQAQLKKELKWLQRGSKARTSKPKSHIDRVKELIDKSYLTENQEMNISFQSQRLGNTILELKNISMAYNKPLMTNFNHVFQKMERIGVIGPNGCGKTSMLRIIANQIKPNNGSIKVGLNTKIAYYEQDYDSFDPNQTVIKYIKEKAEFIRTSDGKQHSAAEMLEQFLFIGKIQYSRISSLSGGERKRLYLLRSLMEGANFLILDEPTNDLDIQTLEVLEDFLDAWRGCILLVSHDRFILDRIADYLFVFDNEGIIRKFAGNYSDYLLVKRFKEEEQKEAVTEKTDTRHPKVTRKLSYKDKQLLLQTEQKISDLENLTESLNQRLILESATLSAQDYESISHTIDNTNIELEEAMALWEALETKRLEIEQ